MHLVGNLGLHQPCWSVQGRNPAKQRTWRLARQSHHGGYQSKDQKNILIYNKTPMDIHGSRFLQLLLSLLWCKHHLADDRKMVLLLMMFSLQGLPLCGCLSNRGYATKGEHIACVGTAGIPPVSDINNCYSAGIVEHTSHVGNVTGIEAA